MTVASECLSEKAFPAIRYSFQFDFQLPAIIDDPAALPAVLQAVFPDHVTSGIGFHRILAVRPFFQPGAGIQVHDQPVGMRMQGRRFSVPNRDIQYPDSPVLEQHLIDVRRKPGRVEGCRYRGADGKPGNENAKTTGKQKYSSCVQIGPSAALNGLTQPARACIVPERQCRCVSRTLSCHLLVTRMEEEHCWIYY
ncbi:MAG: hypothetical protein U5K38_10235 [Woeseiaceae bacterium]|nr:hypothetical protein [Woeseiaceae bacterium]